ncbi:hypothetical protein ARMSODRAFT_672765, partial [Armillaria solidipes]
WWLYEPSESTGSEPVTYRTRSFPFFPPCRHTRYKRVALFVPSRARTSTGCASSESDAAVNPSRLPLLSVALSSVELEFIFSVDYTSETSGTFTGFTTCTRCLLTFPPESRLCTLVKIPSFLLPVQPFSGSWEKSPKCACVMLFGVMSESARLW